MKLRLNAYLIIMTILPIIMIGLNQFPSWSQYAQSGNEILLDGTLLAIILFWYELKYWKGAAAFAGILLTDVTLQALATPHYIFTGLGALFALLFMYKIGKWQGRSAILGMGLFLLGFLTPLYSTAVGEWLYLVIGAINLVFYVNSETV